MKKKPLLVPVTPRALFQRLNRALAKKGERLIANRRTAAFPALGNYYTVDTIKNSVANADVYPEDLAKELGVLKPYEYLEKER